MLLLQFSASLATVNEKLAKGRTAKEERTSKRPDVCLCVCVESNANGYVPTPLFFFSSDKTLTLGIDFCRSRALNAN